MRHTPARPEQLPPLVTTGEDLEVLGIKLRLAAGQPIRDTLEDAVCLLSVATDLTTEVIGGLCNPDNVKNVVAAAEALVQIAASAVNSCVVPLIAIEKRAEVTS